jgi:N-terminal domain of reverse transcriptase
LQKRIYQASSRGDVKLVRKLQKLLISSRSARRISVRRVTQDNQGKKTAGVEGVKSLTPKQRLTLIKDRRTDDNSRFTEERNDGKLSRSVLESSEGGNSFTDFNFEGCSKKSNTVGLTEIYAR